MRDMSPLGERCVERSFRQYLLFKTVARLQPSKTCLELVNYSINIVDTNMPEYDHHEWTLI